jgi:hypothetical protein
MPANPSRVSPASMAGALSELSARAIVTANASVAARVRVLSFGGEKNICISPPGVRVLRFDDFNGRENLICR